MAQHTRDEVERIVRQYVESYSAKDKPRNMEVVHPDHVFAFPEMSLVDPAFENRGGAAAHAAALDADVDFMVDLTPRIDRLLVDGDVCITEGFLTATKLGPNPMTGEGPKDVGLNTRFTAVWDIEDHQVRRVCWYYDMALMYMVQAGMDPQATLDAFTAISGAMAAADGT